MGASPTCWKRCTSGPARAPSSVYNPYALLHLFASREFKAHWFETATPRFLVDTLMQRGFSAPDLENVHADDDLLSAFDVDAVATEALLFQTGYLTVTGEEKDPDGFLQYRLGYPNREVRRGLNRRLLDTLAPNWRSAGDAGALRRLLAAQDWSGVERLVRRLLAGIPHDWRRRNDLARYEGYWSSVFYAWFQASLDGAGGPPPVRADRLLRGVRLPVLLVVEGARAKIFWRLGDAGGGMASRRCALAPTGAHFVPPGGTLCGRLGGRRGRCDSADLAGRVGWQIFEA